VGRGSVNIAGPSGSTAVGTIGTDQNAIVYTKSGFATPFINIGPSVNAIDDPGAIGGWALYPTGTLGEPDYDLIAQQKLPGTALPAGLTGPAYSLIKGVTGPTGPSMSYVAGNNPYASDTSLITTTIGTNQTRIYQIGPITTLSTTKLLIMANVCLISNNKHVQITVGRATTTAASNTNSTNIVSGSSPVTLPVTSNYMAAAINANETELNLNGFALDVPGAAAEIFYTIWASSDTSHNYTEMTAVLTALEVTR
jgi:hypothetical protein